MSLLIYGLFARSLHLPVAAATQTGYAEKITLTDINYMLPAIFSACHALISNENTHKSTDSSARLLRKHSWTGQTRPDAICGGEGGIRTHDPVFDRIPLFESGAFNRSATSPIP